MDVLPLTNNIAAHTHHTVPLQSSMHMHGRSADRRHIRPCSAHSCMLYSVAVYIWMPALHGSAKCMVGALYIMTLHGVKQICISRGFSNDILYAGRPCCPLAPSPPCTTTSLAAGGCRAQCAPPPCTWLPARALASLPRRWWLRTLRDPRTCAGQTHGCSGTWTDTSHTWWGTGGRTGGARRGGSVS